MLVIAHRGESYDRLENTLSSVELAWEREVQAVEVDIQLTSDKRIVVFHDTNTKRIGNVDKEIKKTSLRDLRKLKLRKEGTHSGSFERISTLDEILQTVPIWGRIVIEIKSDDRILKELRNVLKSANLLVHQIEIICFDLDVLIKAKNMMPDYRFMWLLDLDYYLPHWLIFVNVKKMARRVMGLGLGGVDVWSGNFLNQTFVEEFHERNLLVYTWTVNKLKEAEKLRDIGVDGITTDVAGLMNRKLLKR